MACHRFTPEQVEFITANVAGIGHAELRDLVNNYFHIQLGLNQIAAFIKNHKLNSGLNGRFKPGHAPYNKGKTGHHGGEVTQFKTGHKPWNYKPVGTERIDGDGYVGIKTTDPNKWRPKHLIIWEAANGPAPKGHAVIFGDGNRFNFDLNNLLLVSRKELAVLNHKDLIQGDAELTRSGILIAKLILKYSGCKKRSRKNSELVYTPSVKE